MHTFKLDQVRKTQEDLNQEADDRREHKRTDRVTLWFNGILAVFTVLLALATGLLFRETKRLRVAALQQGKDAAKSIDLARRAVEMAETLELPIFIIEKSDDPSLRTKIEIRLGNHGPLRL